MEQAKHYICNQCANPVVGGHKFCGRCGAPVPDEVKDPSTHYFGELQSPGSARLILIRGLGGAEGISYSLQNEEHIVGSDEGQILFPDDEWVSRRHARFYYEDAALMVEDLGSDNGVYVRIEEEERLSQGQRFLCGEQVFVAELEPALEPYKTDDETYFYTSPAEVGSFRIKHQLEGGLDGSETVAKAHSLTLGRENCDINFPQDVYISGSHAEVRQSDGALYLKDLESRNGTYVRAQRPRQLRGGSYVFIGKQLLRVEMSE